MLSVVVTLSKVAELPENNAKVLILRVPGFIIEAKFLQVMLTLVIVQVPPMYGLIYKY